ncbi:MAG: tetratricopeptide repeat protein [Dysgonamonadaceae bacterium]|jgi:tetratricopeptide (TPR) repeat protein|nr:tetratricopeptide repeat protein [Dysgonamonadaceae bacterium]
MNKLMIFLSFLAVVCSVSAQSSVEQANKAYSEADYAQAEQLYKEAIEQEGESAEVYYNLGNTCYRLNKTASSILYYERALLLDPGNQDIRFNLEMARLKTVDKIEPVGEFFLTKWFGSLRDVYGISQWSRTAVITFLLFIACLYLFFFSRKITLKKTGFFAGLAFILICLFANIFAFQQKKRLMERSTAIIFAPTTTIKSSPDTSGTDLFILHEGTKVEIKNQLGEWNEIETAGGDVGWIKSNEIEII